VVLTILSACSIIQLAGPCFRVIMEFSSFYLTPRRRFKYSDDEKGHIFIHFAVWYGNCPVDRVDHNMLGESLPDKVFHHNLGMVVYSFENVPANQFHNSDYRKSSYSNLTTHHSLKEKGKIKEINQSTRTTWSLRDVCLTNAAELRDLKMRTLKDEFE
ncbi:unnamed protein product, partial [Porites evermanni]